MSHASIQIAIRQHENLSELIEKYPSQSSSVCQTLLDLTYASRWQHLRLIDMQTQQTSQQEDENKSDADTLICGLRPEAKGLEAVWCCTMTDILQTARFKQIFSFLDTLDLHISDINGKEVPLLKDHFLLAVHASDATVVYYNIARGLVKPIN